jgi:DNA-binding PadR family transcriptional regulator
MPHKSDDKCFLPGSSFHEHIGKVMYISFLFWFISRKKVHGYEIIKLLRQEAGFMNVGSAHVYPLLSE